MEKTKQKIYLDTSVVSALFDERQDDRRRQTEEFWNALGKYEVYVSTLVLKEIGDHPNEAKRTKLLETVKPFKTLDPSREGIRDLSERYVEAEVIPATHMEDAIHLAIVTVHQVDILVSWNYKHMVKLETIKKIQSINVLNGYRQIEIVTPLSL